MPNSKQIVYLSQAQYAELIANGTITVDGVTVTYDENDIYVTPQAEPVTDVRVNGMSVSNGGVANVPMGSDSILGVVRGSSAYGTHVLNNGTIALEKAGVSYVKAGLSDYRPIVTSNQHEATFYGLAKVAGHDEASSIESVGTYTPEAKGAIQQMLGVSDLIATAENNLVASKAYAIGDVFTANGKLYKATAAIAADAAIIPAVEGEEVAGANCVETSVGEGFVKFTDYATAGVPGIAKVWNTYGVDMIGAGNLRVFGASDAEAKAGAHNYRPITPNHQHQAVFYGLAKAAGADEKDSTLPVGQYTDTAKSAIRSMIGASSTNVIAVQDTQPTDTDTKIWLPETAETPIQIPTMDDMNTALAGKVGDVQVNGVSVVSNGVAEIPVGTDNNVGVFKTGGYGVGVYNYDTTRLCVKCAQDNQVKVGTDLYNPIVSGKQHISTFYGLAKAAGDATQAASNNAVGTYTDEAKAAIRTMLGTVGNEDYATSSTSGVVIANSSYGISIGADGILRLGTASANNCKQQIGSTGYQNITVFNQHAASFYGLATAAGDTTQKASSNAVGIYTDNAKASIKSMLGIVDGSTGTIDVTGTTPTITAVENTRYVCGEVTSLSFTPAASGICIVRFTSGSTVTVLTLPSTVKFPEWFDPTSLETNTIYEICITDGIYGAVMSWAQ